MAVSDAHKRASAKWNASRDNIMIRPEKEEGQKIQTFILNAVRREIEDGNDR